MLSQLSPPDCACLTLLALRVAVASQALGTDHMVVRFGRRGLGRYRHVFADGVDLGDSLVDTLHMLIVRRIARVHLARQALIRIAQRARHQAADAPVRLLHTRPVTFARHTLRCNMHASY